MKTTKWLMFCKWLILIIVMSFAKSIAAEGCVSVLMQTLTVTPVTLERNGFPELCDVSTPPKRYLISSSYDDRTYSDNYDNIFGPDSNGNSVEDSGNDYNNINIADITTMTAINGYETKTTNGSASFNVYANELWYPFNDDGNAPWPYTNSASATVTANVWSDNGAAYGAVTAGWLGGYGGDPSGNGFYPPSGVAATINCSSTSTSGSWSATGDTHVLPVGAVHNLGVRDASAGTTLSVENDDTMLRGNMMSLLQPFSTNWVNGGGSAYMTFADTNCLSATGDKIQYRFQITNWQPNHTYKFSWQLTTTTTSILTNTVTVTTATVGPVEVNPTGDATQPYYYYPNNSEIDIPPIEPPTMSISISPNNPSTPVDVTPGTAGN